MNSAVIYARYSSRKQNEQSIDGQLRICHEFAKRENLKVIHEYIDRAASGTNDKRPSFQEMLNDAANGNFQVVIVYQFDRFARNRRDSLNNKYFLKAHNVKVLSATEPIPTDDPGSIFIEGMLETVAEYYSRDLSKKTKRGINESIIKRKFIGGYIPLGYSVAPDKSIIINDEEAKLVKRIFKNYVEDGMSIKEIIDDLNKFGFTKRGVPFGKNSFQHMMKNRKYIGEYTFHDEIITDMYPAIIDRAVFLRAQELLSMKSHQNRAMRASDEHKNYFLTGKIYCGNCGSKMVGVSGYSRSGKIYRYYKCTKKSCNKLAERKDFIEWYVAEQIVKYLNNEDRLNYIALEVVKIFKEESANSSIQTLSNQKAALEKQLEKIVDNFVGADGIIKKKLNQRATLLSEQIQNCADEIAIQKVAKSKFVTDPEFIKSFVKTVLGQFQNTARDYQRVSDYFLNSVFLFDDKIVIYLNFADSQIVSYVKMLADVDKMQKEKNTPTKECSHDDDDGDPVDIPYEPIWQFSQSASACIGILIER